MRKRLVFRRITHVGNIPFRVESTHLLLYGGVDEVEYEYIVPQGVTSVKVALWGPGGGGGSGQAGASGGNGSSSTSAGAWGLGPRPGSAGYTGTNTELSLDGVTILTAESGKGATPVTSASTVGGGGASITSGGVGGTAITSSSSYPERTVGGGFHGVVQMYGSVGNSSNASSILPKDGTPGTIGSGGYGGNGATRVSAHPNMTYHGYSAGDGGYGGEGGYGGSGGSPASYVIGGVGGYGGGGGQGGLAGLTGSNGGFVQAEIECTAGQLLRFKIGAPGVGGPTVSKVQPAIGYAGSGGRGGEGYWGLAGGDGAPGLAIIETQFQNPEWDDKNPAAIWERIVAKDIVAKLASSAIMKTDDAAGSNWFYQWVGTNTVLDYQVNQQTLKESSDVLSSYVLFESNIASKTFDPTVTSDTLMVVSNIVVHDSQWYSSTNSNSFDVAYGPNVSLAVTNTQVHEDPWFDSLKASDSDASINVNTAFAVGNNQEPESITMWESIAVVDSMADINTDTVWSRDDLGSLNLAQPLWGALPSAVTDIDTNNLTLYGNNQINQNAMYEWQGNETLIDVFSPSAVYDIGEPVTNNWMSWENTSTPTALVVPATAVWDDRSSEE